MDRIRLIASDMDATLLDGHSQLPPDFLHLVQELAGQDILFAVASGRPLYKLEEMFAPVLEQTLLVADNGGAVRWRGKDLFVSRMEPEVWHRLTACAEENGDSFVVCGLENAYLRPCDRCYDAVYRNFYNRIAYVSDLYTIDAAVDKFTIYLPQDNAQEVYEKVYGPRFGQELAVAVSGKCWIDVTNPGVTKGKAVERLSRLLDIPSGAMMAFGDTYNDIEMLEAVGYGFLMENGSPELRSRVPYLAPPNTEYGVARVLQQVLRQKGCVCPADAEIDTLGIHVTPNGGRKAVLLYDTEQSEVQLFKNVSNLLARAKQPDKPDELKAFCLTGMSRKERLNAIVQSMDKFYYQYGGIQLVVIDGIADLVKSANDEAESVAVIDELYRLAGIYNTCILCVLHFVPNGLKLRGHLGSELQRKAATILSIEKDEEPTQSVVKALKVRDGSPLDVPLMLFAWDKKAGMHVYKGEKPREEKEKRKERELVNVARDIFGRQTRITYIDLCEQLQQVLDIKERTAKSYIRFMRERDIITKDTANQSCFVIGSYNLRWNTSCP